MGLFLWDSEPSKIFVGDTAISKVFLWDAQVRPTWWLPSEYQEVEYIQSSWTQSINTWVYMNPNYTVEVKYQLATFNSNYQTIFWCRRWNYEKFVARFRKSDWTLALQRAKNATAVWENKWDYSGYYDSNIHTIKMNMYGYMDDTLLCTFSSSTFTGHFSITLYLFALNASELSTPIVDFAEMKLYSAKIYDTDETTLIRNFVPCYRKSDNVIWVYDLATNTFYTNAGTGTFTKWWDV